MTDVRKTEPRLVTTVHMQEHLIGITVWGDPRFDPGPDPDAVLVHADRIAYVAQQMCKLAGIPQPGDLEWARKAKDLLLRAHEYVQDAMSDSGMCRGIHKADVATAESLLEDIEDLLPEAKDD